MKVQKLFLRLLLLIFCLSSISTYSNDEIVLTIEELRSYTMEAYELRKKIEEVKSKKKFAPVLLAIEAGAALFFLRKAVSYSDYSKRDVALRKLFRIERAMQGASTRGYKNLWLSAAAAAAVTAGFEVKYILVDSVEELEALEAELIEIEDILIEEKSRAEILNSADEFEIEE